jgi:ABC-type taurine transport system ATPase subunit
MSDKSGAYDDLAGIAMQLAAGAWLLDARDSPWSTCLADEPFAHTDASLRRGLARFFANAPGRSIFRQLFLIAHSNDAIDMLPHRIEIVVSKDGERRIVQR